jgi:hypothetical protein
MVRSNLLPSLLLLLSQAARSEIIPLELIIDASTEEVHFVRGENWHIVMRSVVARDWLRFDWLQFDSILFYSIISILTLNLACNLDTAYFYITMY